MLFWVKDFGQGLDRLAKDVVLLRRAAEGRGDVREVLECLFRSHLILIHAAGRPVKSRENRQANRSAKGSLRDHNRDFIRIGKANRIGNANAVGTGIRRAYVVDG